MLLLLLFRLSKALIRFQYIICFYHMTFRNIFLKIVRMALLSQSGDGSMPSGHNGAYQDSETPVRNTSHYLIAFARAHELSGEVAFSEAALRCLDWLVKRNLYREGYTFHHRTSLGKDRCNGLIGPAWNMEALLFAAERYNRQDARDLAREIFLLHPFIPDIAVWKRVEPNGSLLTFDATFNHQLWFAACAAPLAVDTLEAKMRIEAFLHGTAKNWQLARNGRIIHPLWLPKRRLRETVKRLVKPDYRRNVISREIGYHAFNLQAFALFKLAGIRFPKHVEKRIHSALAYLNHPEFTQGIEKSEWGYPYNPPGWEVSVALMILGDADPYACRPWLERQISHSYDSKSQTLSCGTDDTETHTARIYEVACLPDSIFNLDLTI